MEKKRRPDSEKGRRGGEALKAQAGRVATVTVSMPIDTVTVTVPFPVGTVTVRQRTCVIVGERDGIPMG